MSKVQIPPRIPEKPPAPKQTPRASNTPPFTPPQPKPRPAAPPPASTAQPRRAPAKNPKQARTAPQAAPDERSSSLSGRTREAPDLNEDPNASTRFDGWKSQLPGGFFSEFTDTSDFMAQGSNGASLGELTEAAAADDPLDCIALEQLLPTGENDGIFDVILPSGEHLGVVVSGKPSSLSYLLSPSSDKLASRLRRRRMELEDSLERLTHRNVNITVL